MLLHKWIVRMPLTLKDNIGCVIAFPGRGVPGSLMLRFCREMKLKRTTFAALQPYGLAWYPMPNGAEDQNKAVQGLEWTLPRVQNAVHKFLAWREIKPEQTVLMGFSAGAVIALQVAMHSQERFAACVSLSGAILEPEKIPEATNDMPVILQHNADDTCFDWYERYIPMREGLKSKGYNVRCLERNYGSHTLYVSDAVKTSRIVAPLIGYPKSYADKQFGKEKP